MSHRAPIRGALLFLFLLPSFSQADEVRVYAATVLRDPLEDAAKAYANATHNTVSFTFAGSVELGRQIATGSVADLFFSSGRPQIDALEKLGLVSGDSKVDLLSNALVLITPVTSTLQLKNPQDLKPVARIAIPNAKLSQAGEYIRTFLEAKGLLAELEPHFLLFPTSRDTAAAVGQGSADAGVVYRTDAKLFAKVRIALEVMPDEKDPITYVLVPLTRSKSSAAKDFFHFLQQGACSAIFEHYGFIVLAHEKKP